MCPAEKAGNTNPQVSGPQLDSGAGPSTDVNSYCIRQALWLDWTFASFAGCGRQESAVETLAIGIDQDIPTLDPAMHRSRTVESVLRNIFDGLVTRDSQMRVVPEIASSWRRLDELTWEFQIREGIHFHNGDPLTAEDAAFTIQRTITPEAIGGQSSPRKGLLGSVVAAEAVAAHTLQISRPTCPRNAYRKKGDVDE